MAKEEKKRVNLTKRQIAASLERRILTGMVMSTKFLQSVQSMYREGALVSDYATTVANWCVEYFNDYREAPGSEIQTIYSRAVVDERISADMAEAVATYLSRLAQTYDEDDYADIQHLLHQTEKEFAANTMKKNMADAEALLSMGKVSEAIAMVRGMEVPALPTSVGLDVFGDFDSVYANMTSVEEDLFTLPGDIGTMFGPFQRDSFWSIMAPEKRGKTFFLTDLSVKCAKRGFRTAFFQAGDLSEKQMEFRIFSHFTKMPIRRRKKAHRVPVLDCKWNQLNDCGKRQRTCNMGCMTKKKKIMRLQDLWKDGYKACTVCKRLGDPAFSPATFWEERHPEAFDPRFDLKTAMKDAILDYRLDDKYKLVCTRRGQTNIAMIDTTLERWRDETGWIPDFLFLDYFGILGREPGTSRMQPLEAENETWGAARALCQKWNLCLFGATQGNRGSHLKESMDVTDVAMDKRKLAEITHLITLNQTKEEKRKGVMRIALALARAQNFDSEREVVIHQDLHTGQALMRSFFIPLEEEADEDLDNDAESW